MGLSTDNAFQTWDHGRYYYFPFFGSIFSLLLGIYSGFFFRFFLSCFILFNYTHHKRTQGEKQALLRDARDGTVVLSVWSGLFSFLLFPSVYPCLSNTLSRKRRGGFMFFFFFFWYVVSNSSTDYSRDILRARPCMDDFPCGNGPVKSIMTSPFPPMPPNDFASSQ